MDHRHFGRHPGSARSGHDQIRTVGRPRRWSDGNGPYGGVGAGGIHFPSLADTDAGPWRAAPVGSKLGLGDAAAGNGLRVVPEDIGCPGPRGARPPVAGPSGWLRSPTAIASPGCSIPGSLLTWRGCTANNNTTDWETSAAEPSRGRPGASRQTSDRPHPPRGPDWSLR